MNTRTATLLTVVALTAAGLVALFPNAKEPGQASRSREKIQWHECNEGISLARQKNKKILIDVYTDWCSWCKKMDKEVYTDEEVRKAIASSFVAVKLNAESSKAVTFNGDQTDEATFARAIGVTGYPTTVFLEPTAQPITTISGYMQPKDFASALRYIGGDHYKRGSFDQFRSSEKSSQLK